LKESAASYFDEQRDWMQCHPQMGSEPEIVTENIKCIAKWLIDQNLAPDAANVNEAFVSLALEGKLNLDAVACGAGDQTQVTENELVCHPNLWKILEPIHFRDEDQERIARQSANDFLREHIDELRPSGIPPLVLDGLSKCFETFLSVHPEFIRLNENEIAMREAVLASALPISTQLLESVYKQLSGEGKLKTNPGVTAQHGQTRIKTYPSEPKTPIKQHQNIEIRERTKRFSPAQTAAMDSAEFAKWCENSDFVEQVDQMER
jgi:hypothetical protein